MDWEGTIPSGYGAGTVEIWEKGQLVLDERTPDLVRFHIDEGKLKGSWCLARDDGTKWYLSNQIETTGTETVPSTLTKTEIIGKLQEIAERLQVSGEDNEFRVRSYKSAAGIVQRARNFEQLTEEQLKQLPGLGSALCRTINDLRTIGTTKLLEELAEAI
jgi:hypothetical protein